MKQFQLLFLVVNGRNVRRGCAVISTALQPMSCCTVLTCEVFSCTIREMTRVEYEVCYCVVLSDCDMVWLRRCSTHLFRIRSILLCESKIFSGHDPQFLNRCNHNMGKSFDRIVWVWGFLNFHRCQLASWFVYEEPLDFLVITKEQHISRNFELNAEWTDLEERVIILSMDLWIYRNVRAA